MRSKLTETIQTTILDSLAAGNTRTVAAQVVGISPETVRTWMRRGEKESKGRYCAFQRAVLSAESQAEKAAVGTIEAAWNRGEWRAAAWWLERRRPEAYGVRKDQNSTQPVEPTTIRICYDNQTSR